MQPLISGRLPHYCLVNAPSITHTLKFNCSLLSIISPPDPVFAPRLADRVKTEDYKRVVLSMTKPRMHLSIGLLAALCSNNIFCQTQLNLATQSKNVDFSNQPFVRPFPTGATPPASCSVGQMFFQTSSPAGVNACVAANTWQPIQSPAVIGAEEISSTQLAIGSSCSIAAPCVFRIGSVGYGLTAPAVVTVTGGSGMAYFYIDQNGNLVAGVSTSQVSCVGCQVVEGVTQYPLNSIPIASWNAANGVWDASGNNDLGLLNAGAVLNAGPNITITQTGQTVTISSTASSSAGTVTFNPTDPTQFYRNHLFVASAFNQVYDGWSYTGPCNGSGSQTGNQESFVSSVQWAVSGAGTVCFNEFPQGMSAGGYSYDYWSAAAPPSLWVSATLSGQDTNGTLVVGLSDDWDGIHNFIGCQQAGSGVWTAVVIANGVVISSGGATTASHDTNTHRVVVDNNGGAAGTIRCSVDGGTPATATGTIPAAPGGWQFVVGGVSAGSTSMVFNLFDYTIFLQGLPRI